MQQAQLQLYPAIEHKPSVTSETMKVISQTPINLPHPHQTLTNAAKSVFQQDMQDSLLARTRKNLGPVAQTLSDEQIETIITEFQFLISSWLDEYEKEIFNGLTLREVINGA